MKKKSIRFLMVMMVIVLAIAMSACGDDSSSGEKDNEIGAPKFAGDDISYEIGNTRFDDYRATSIRFTNNSDYDILSWDMTFSVTGKIKGVKGDYISTDSSVLSLTAPGAESIDIQLYDDETYEGISATAKVADNVKPDVLKVLYREKGSDDLFEATYDYVNNETKYEESDYKLNKWENKLATALPKPDSECILIDEDSGDWFKARVLGATKKEWEKYAKDCYKAGIKDFKEKYTDDSYYGTNPKDKSTVDIEYSNIGYSIDISGHNDQ